ncbi:MAG TPA: isoprenylcysteine carboxylmethyltransferase family protein [Bacteroidales bacterium]|nr:isoprenylcysteine carboxylmethyltransferase family protein [Bacteroidales bacterium]
MSKLNFYGVGPKIGRIALPWLAVTIIVSIVLKGSFRFFPDEHRILFFIGLALVILGFIMYFSTIPALLKGIKETRLVTKGAFYLCCNPLYAAIILFMIPGTSFMMNSWLVFSASVVAYIVFKLQIKGEETEMEKFFGEEYKAYRSSTPEFFPVPVKKLFK